MTLVLNPDTHLGAPSIVSDILRIDNLWQFESLQKLQLDNNIIEKIEGLENLTHLVWLGRAPRGPASLLAPSSRCSICWKQESLCLVMVTQGCSQSWEELGPGMQGCGVRRGCLMVQCTHSTP